MKLSIIIPYFETYELTEMLIKTLSIQNDPKNIEIIVIDDGCKETRLDKLKYLLCMDNMKIWHQENMGVAKSRNKGIELAKGKYVAFIDCDDMITPNYVKSLLERIECCEKDIINFNWLDYSENVVYKKPANYAPWKAIYKKETMLKFREDREYGEEDVDFQLEINDKLAKGEYSITYLNRVLYIYNSNREGSLFWKKLHQHK